MPDGGEVGRGGAPRRAPAAYAGSMMNECRVCRSNSGVERISPAPTIHESEHWLVEHAYPSSLLGWLVIVLKRHAEALHELTREEAAELGTLQWAVADALAATTGCLKEYAMLVAEQPGFHHAHVHLVPRAHDLPAELRGGDVFHFLRPTDDDVLAHDRVRTFCDELAEALEKRLA